MSPMKTLEAQGVRGLRGHLGEAAGQTALSCTRPGPAPGPAQPWVLGSGAAGDRPSWDVPWLPRGAQSHESKPGNRASVGQVTRKSG